jgi:hypothetical protein
MFLFKDVSETGSASGKGGGVEAARTSETSVDNYFTRQYIPKDNSEIHMYECFSSSKTSIM